MQKLFIVFCQFPPVAMNIKEEKLCRFCFDLTGNDFAVIDKMIKETLDVLSLKMNLEITEKPTMCGNCSETVKRLYNFKLNCSEIEGFIKKEIKVESEEDSVDENSRCRFCMISQSCNDFIPLDVLLNAPMFGEIWPIVLSGMDIKDIKSSLVCTHCKDNLERYFRFVQNCWDTEEKINIYCQHHANNTNGKVSLSSVQHFLTDYISEYSDQWVKYEADLPEHVSVEPIDDILKHEELNIKDEAFSLDENFGQNSGANICDESCNKNDKSAVITKLYKCEGCTYETKYKSDIKNHVLVHKNVSKVEMYGCALCTYETNRKGSLKSHMLKHKDSSEVEMYKCPLCSHETKHKSDLKKHVLIHKDTSEVEMYKCALCAYETKHKGNLKSHILIHKDTLKAETYKCTLCIYETRKKGHLNRHMLIHKDTSEVEMYKCALCSYEAKLKSNLKNHVLIHKDSSEVEMYKCKLCSFETKFKSNVKKHMQTHKAATISTLTKAEINTHEVCGSDAKLKMGVKAHTPTPNMDLSKVKMYKCTLCIFETKYERTLRGHMQIHKNT